MDGVLSIQVGLRHVEERTLTHRRGQGDLGPLESAEELLEEPAHLLEIPPAYIGFLPSIELKLYSLLVRQAVPEALSPHYVAELDPGQGRDVDVGDACLENLLER